MRAPMSLALALLCTSTASCSIVDAPSQHVPDPIPASVLCDRLATVYCGAAAQCCPSADMGAAPDAGPGTSCTDLVASWCSHNDVVQGALGDSRTGYDPQIAGEVIAEATYMVQSCDLSFAHWLTQRDGFLRFLTGTVSEGLPCLENTPLTMVPASAFFRCSGGGGCFVEGVPMHLGEVTGTCRPQAADGRECQSDLDCRDGAYCANTPPDGATSGRSCRRQGVPGDHCTGDAMCASGVCSCSGVLCSGMCQSPTRVSVYCR